MVSARQLGPWLIQALTTIACGDGGTAPAPGPPAVTVSSVTVAPATVAIGGSIVRTATVMNAAGNPISSIVITWSSDHGAVAGVTSEGVVTGLTAGDATIRATAGGVTGSAAVRVADLVFVDLSVGARHACALTSTGQTWCWGDNTRGEGVGSGTETCSTLGDCSLTPATAIGWPLAIRLTLGAEHSCTLDGGGTARCWGRNSSSEIGAETSGTCRISGNSVPCARAPMAVSGGRIFTSLSAGGTHTCGVTAQGTAWCWGNGQSGQLGVSGGGNASEPQAVVGGLQFSAVAAGGFHSCGIAVAGGAAWCWGDNAFGQLGDGNPGGHVPRQVSGGLTFVAISAGVSHTCGLTSSGSAWCWGSNAYGQLGDASTSDSNAPRAVAGGFTFSSISVGQEHTCALTTAGAAYCWGHNLFGGGLGSTVGGQLGDGSTADRTSPTAVARNLTFVQIAAGRSATCARTASGSAYCWGDARFGQLGDGDARRANSTTPYRSTPVGVAGVP